MVHSVLRASSIRLNGFPFLKRNMSLSDSVVSSEISLFAASSGLGSDGSIEPEQTAHLPLASCDR